MAANVRAEAVAALQARLGHAFKDGGLLDHALIHASVGEGARKTRDNERLEFLGDRVLGLLAAEALMARDPKASEGRLAPQLNALVSRATCARVGRGMQIGPALRLSAAETRTGGREKKSILAGAVEAVMAALYLDGGLDPARAAFLQFWREEIEALDQPGGKDPKTALQEWAQGRGLPLPAYAVTERTGPEHAPTFTVAAQVEGLEPALGLGTNRQMAEKAAAQALLAREANP